MKSDVPEEVKFLYLGELFYFYDTGLNFDNRIIIFCTSKNLTLLCSSDIRFIDVTFKVVPNGFEQILIIKTVVKNKKHSLFFALMKKKNEISYDKVFSLIKEKESNIKVSWIIVNFELALVNSCIKNFENVRVRGC
jgi:hypothetical protein